MKRKLERVWQWARLILGVVGILVLFVLVDGDAAIAALSDVKLTCLAPAMALPLFSTTAKAWRWILLLRQRNIRIPLRRLLSTYLIGNFYGQLLPGASVAGATELFADSARYGGRSVDFFVTVVVDRVVNLLALFAGASFLLLVAPPAGLLPHLALTIHLVSITLVTGLLLLKRGWGAGWIRRLSSRAGFPKVDSGIGMLNQALQSELGGWRVIFGAIFLSLFANVCSITASYLVVVAVAGPISYLGFVAMAAPIITLEGIPLTPGNLGVREGVNVLFLGHLGVSEPSALSVGLLVFMLGWLRGLIGGLLLLRRSLFEVVDRMAWTSVKGIFSRLKEALGMIGGVPQPSFQTAQAAFVVAFVRRSRPVPSQGLLKPPPAPAFRWLGERPDAAVG